LIKYYDKKLIEPRRLHQDFVILGTMAFKDRLREEIEYRGWLIKEISAKTGITNSTFLSYIDARGVLPNVESGVKIAKALGVSVEYLVTGERTVQDPKYTAINDIIRDLYQLSSAQVETIKCMIHGLVR
jgi:DNA-binding protein